jgi:hypothetical protein
MSEESSYDWLYNPKVEESDLFRDYKRVVVERDRLREALKETVEELSNWLEDRMAGTDREPEDHPVVAKALSALKEEV